VLEIVDRTGPHSERLVEVTRNIVTGALDDDLIERAAGLETEAVRIAPGITKAFKIEAARKDSSVESVKVADVGPGGSVSLFHGAINNFS